MQYLEFGEKYTYPSAYIHHQTDILILCHCGELYYHEDTSMKAENKPNKIFFQSVGSKLHSRPWRSLSSDF